jgi:histidyl-tRNA synthetase
LADRTVPVLRSLDKLAKLGRQKTILEMCEAAKISEQQADPVLRLAECEGEARDVLSQLPNITGGNETAAAGIERLTEIYNGALAAGVPQRRLKLDVSIARGLDYYTGVIFETTLNDLPDIGSVCSGGRYDNLAELYTKQHLPGIGASLGLDRLLAAMEKLKLLPTAATPAPVFIPYFEANHRDDYLRMAANLRAAGVNTEIFPDAKKLGMQLKYADSHGFTIAIIAGGNEWTESRCQIKILASKQSEDVNYTHDQPEELVRRIQSVLDSQSPSSSGR